jgi:uncharacterized repeat protein (TIGR03803 family)
MRASQGSAFGKFGFWNLAGISFVFLATTTITSAAQGTLFTTLASFNGANGGNPGFGSLVRGVDGNFYGTTADGGAHNGGTVFKITPAGELTTLYSFCAQTNCTDGGSPAAQLVLGNDGNFYGTTSGGGEFLYYGTVFKITPAGALTTLHSFQAYPTDGDAPVAPLVQGSDGNFYGTTSSGGSSPACQYPGCGTAFKITPAGELTTIFSFCAQRGCVDGWLPWAGLTQGSDGNFYGTTYRGGNSNGTAFKLTPAGVLTVLHSFCAQGGCSDGGNPYAGLTQGTDGNFYGTTTIGGALGSYGTVYKVTPQGSFTTLHSFDGTNGAEPWSGLVQAPGGIFYGTTAGGTTNPGTVFSLLAVHPCAKCGPGAEDEDNGGRLEK